MMTDEPQQPDPNPCLTQSALNELRKNLEGHRWQELYQESWPQPRNVDEMIEVLAKERRPTLARVRAALEHQPVDLLTFAMLATTYLQLVPHDPAQPWWEMQFSNRTGELLTYVRNTTRPPKEPAAPGPPDVW